MRERLPFLLPPRGLCSGRDLVVLAVTGSCVHPQSDLPAFLDDVYTNAVDERLVSPVLVLASHVRKILLLSCLSMS